MTQHQNKLLQPIDASFPIEERYVDAFIRKIREHSFTGSILTSDLEAEIREVFPKAYGDYDFFLSERHLEIPTKNFVAVYEKSGVKKHQSRLAYNPYKWVLSEDPAGWPTGWWFRFGQEKWGSPDLSGLLNRR